MAETRKLAAILAAHVAGYSKLTAADEERTFARLRARRSELIGPHHCLASWPRLQSAFSARSSAKIDVGD